MDMGSLLAYQDQQNKQMQIFGIQQNQLKLQASATDAARETESQKISGQTVVAKDTAKSLNPRNT